MSFTFPHIDPRITTLPLTERPLLHEGEHVTCPECGGRHPVTYVKDGQGRISADVFVFACADQTFVAGLFGRDIVTPPTERA